MNDDLVVVLTITRVETTHLADLVAQFGELLDETGSTASDPAVARLVPDAYRDDEEAAGEFRRITEADLLARRRADAERVGRDLAAVGTDAREPTDLIDVALDAEGVRAWMRVLAAIRLVIASRLGIETEEDHDEDDPRFGVYDWLGYRLEGLVQAVDGGERG